jgi:nucleoside-diphosphate-sugar epimerase
VRVLVTGATGFIGRHALAALGERHEIVAVAREAPPGDLADAASWLEQDLAEALDPSRFPRQVDAVIHLAQSRRYKDFPDGAEDIYAVNVHSTFRLLEWARDVGARTFVLASTGGVYAPSSHPVREDDPVRLANMYFRSKHAAEVLLGAYADLLRSVVLRPFFVYGQGQRGMLIRQLAERIVSGEEVVVDGDPGIRINPLHVEDAVRVFEPALSGTVSGAVNIAGPDVVSITELVAALGEATGVQPVVRHRAAVVDGDLIASTERMRDALGVTPRVGLAEGLQDVAADLSRRAPGPRHEGPRSCTTTAADGTG